MADTRRDSASEPWNRGSCGELLQYLMSATKPSNTVFVSIGPEGHFFVNERGERKVRGGAAAPHGHEDSATHFVFLRGSGRMHFTDPGGGFHTEEIRIDLSNRWVWITVQAGCLYQIENRGNPFPLEYLMTLSPPFDGAKEKTYDPDEARANGWNFAPYDEER